MLRDEIADLRDAAGEPGERTAAGPEDPAGELGEGGSPAQPDARAHPATSGGTAAKDRTADAHDDDAADRDRQARDRDRAAEQRDEAARAAEDEQQLVTDVDARSRVDAVHAREDAAADRRGSEQDRVLAAEERTAAGLDRDASAGDRRHAEQDRDGSATDRVEAMEEIDAASLDALTGVYARGPGMIELERDRSRAARAGEPMALAFVDVDDLKGTNDRAGDPAGDRLLRQVADALQAHLRAHDAVVRYGGDEFVCALMGLTRAEAAERLAAVNTALGAASEPGSITVGIAALEGDESLSSLVERADAALYRQRR